MIFFLGFIVQHTSHDVRYNRGVNDNARHQIPKAGRQLQSAGTAGMYRKV